MTDKQFRMLRIALQSIQPRIRISFTGIIGGLNEEADQQICRVIDKYMYGQNIEEDIDRMVNDRDNFMIGYNQASYDW